MTEIKSKSVKTLCQTLDPQSSWLTKDVSSCCSLALPYKAHIVYLIGSGQLHSTVLVSPKSWGLHCNSAALQPVVSSWPFSAIWYQASSSLHDLFSSQLLLQWSLYLHNDLSWFSHSVRASAALQDPFRPLKLVPPGRLTQPSLANTKCSVGPFSIKVSVCRPWGNTSQKIFASQVLVVSSPPPPLYFLQSLSV